MGETSISWSHFSFNPWVGCSKVSEACQHCYAESWAKRGGNPELWKGERRRTKTWGDPVKWNAKARDTGKFIVFCASLADVFEYNQTLAGWRSDLWHLVKMCPDLFWLMLTKRPENFERFLPWVRTPWPNVGLGVTAENQRWWDERVSILAKTPAAMRFVSYEPALGGVRGDYICGCGDHRNLYCLGCDTYAADWVICGGESGAKARPMHPDWARSMRDQCQEAGVAFHFQAGRPVGSVFPQREYRSG